MQRDVKIGLVLGVLLVAIVAVVFFRRDDAGREKLRHMVPGPEQIAGATSHLLQNQSTDPYPVSSEHLSGWRGLAKSRTQTPAPPRKNDEPASRTAANAPAESDADASQPPAPGPAVDTVQTADAARSRAGTIPVQPRGEGTSRDNATANIPPATTPQEYTIAEGDTLSKIARRVYGRSELYPLLYEANHDVLPDPDNLPLGQKIRIPDAKMPAPPVAERKAESGVYEVRENDTLMRIARRIYRDESMYRAIFEANSDKLVSEKDLKPGMVLRLP